MRCLRILPASQSVVLRPRSLEDQRVGGAAGTVVRAYIEAKAMSTAAMRPKVVASGAPCVSRWLSGIASAVASANVPRLRTHRLRRAWVSTRMARGSVPVPMAREM